MMRSRSDGGGRGGGGGVRVGGVGDIRGYVRDYILRLERRKNVVMIYSS